MDQASVALSSEAERLYLTYALSVIQARALPDVRDGLKPVQRRILYAMLNELALRPDAKPKKCAAIVGDVMGKFHPHGDSAIYEALVRMAQSWVLRAPLVNGQGNFGSLDDGPAAMRYTEARLEPLAMELLSELGKKTVAFRPNYDGTKFEPVVLPARFPNLLVNGASGIAVGMATDVPPHNLGEVIDACLALSEKPEITIKQLLAKVKGPDFPTGGEILNSREELVQIYESGKGSIGIRGEWTTEQDKKGPLRVIITSIPYGLEMRAIVEKIADVINSKKLPALVDVRDESTDKVRVVLELKKDAAPEMVMAYVYKHTPLQTTVQVNMTCLIPTADPEVATPDRLNLKQLLEQFLRFRRETVKARLQFDLDALKKRLHILDGFLKVFDALDEIIKMIRKSEGKADAAQKIMKRFDLDEEQTDAILELKLYRLARLEILVIQQEAEEKKKEAKRVAAIIKSEKQLNTLVDDELKEIKAAYTDKRRSKILREGAEQTEYRAEDFIVDQDAFVIATAQGWVKRQGTVKDLSSTRIREGDVILACQAGSVKASVAFFTNFGGAYVARIDDIPASSGYGDPIQKLFKLGDNERLVGALTFDPRILQVPEATPNAAEPEPPFAVAVTKKGLVFRFSLRAHRDPSTRAGRKFAKLNEGDEVLAVIPTANHSVIMALADDGHAIAVDLEEIPVLSGAGKGVMLIKLDDDARLLAAIGAPSKKVGRLTAFTDKGGKKEITASEAHGTRGGRGAAVLKRGRFDRVELPGPDVPDLGGGEKK